MASRAARWGVRVQRVENKAELADVVTRAVREHLVDPGIAELTMWSGRYGTPSACPHNTPAPEKAGEFPARAFADPVLEQPRVSMPVPMRARCWCW